MLITVIIPFFNRIEFVNNAVKSVINQTYQNWELLLIDDASSEILNFDFNDSRIKLIKNEQNIGPGASRQKGIDHSSGDFICFLDSDDIYKPNFLEWNLKQHSKLNYEICFTYCKTKYDNDGKTYKTSDLEYNEILPTLLLENRPWHTSSIFWNRKYLSKWELDIRTWEDYQFEFNAAFLNNRIGFVNEFLCQIKIDELNGLSQNSEKIFGIIDRLKVLIYMYNKNDKFSCSYKSILVRNIKFRIGKDIIKLYGFNLSRFEYLALLEDLGLIKNLFSKKILHLTYRKPIISKVVFKFIL
jgi:glycosyltransferase involved in cell wall biosynthesis